MIYIASITVWIWAPREVSIVGWIVWYRCLFIGCQQLLTKPPPVIVSCNITCYFHGWTEVHEHWTDMDIRFSGIHILLLWSCVDHHIAVRLLAASFLKLYFTTRSISQSWSWRMCSVCPKKNIQNPRGICLSIIEAILKAGPSHSVVFFLKKKSDLIKPFSVNLMCNCQIGFKTISFQRQEKKKNPKPSSEVAGLLH